MDYRILFDAEFDDYAGEVASKGCLDLKVEFGETVIPLSFYDPIRLMQAVERTLIAGEPFFERNIIVVRKVIRSSIEKAVDE